MLLNDKRIFIVEDNIQNRIIFQVCLLSNGAAIDLEYRGADTIYRLSRLAPVDLIILDLMLSDGISGFDIIKQIRALPAYHTTPIVAVSAMDPSVAIPQAQAVGFTSFIPKPIDKRLFPQQLARIMAGELLWLVDEHN